MSVLDIMSIFGESDFQFTCPGCKSVFAIKFKEIINDGSIITCANCKKEIVVNHTEETKQGAIDLNKSLAKIQEQIRNLGK